MIRSLLYTVAQSVVRMTRDKRDSKLKKLSKLAARQQEQLNSLGKEVAHLRGALQNAVSVMNVMGERIAAALPPGANEEEA